jgi:hypothetical protein
MLMAELRSRKIVTRALPNSEAPNFVELRLHQQAVLLLGRL